MIVRVFTSYRDENHDPQFGIYTLRDHNYTDLELTLEDITQIINSGNSIDRVIFGLIDHDCQMEGDYNIEWVFV